MTSGARAEVKMARRVWIACVVVLAAVGQALAQQNRIDAITPMAPERAAYGSLSVGVRTITATDRDRPDVLNTKEGGTVARYDRTLTIEIWYLQLAALERMHRIEGGFHRTGLAKPFRHRFPKVGVLDVIQISPRPHGSVDAIGEHAVEVDDQASTGWAGHGADRRRTGNSGRPPAATPG